MRTAAIVAAGAVAIGAVPRVLLAAGMLPGWLRPFVSSDLYFMWERGLSGGRVPYLDGYFEYPPLLGYVSGALSLASPSAPVYLLLWAILQMLAAALIAVLLCRETGADRTMRRWSLAPELVLLGTLNLDLPAVAAIVLAVVWARRSRTLRASAALAVGAGLKLFPAVGLPLLVLRASSRPAVALGAAGLFVAILAAAYVPTLGAPYSSAESLTRYSAGIDANPDSIWRTLHALLEGLGVPAAPQVIVIVTNLGLAATYLFLVVPRALRTPDPAVGVGLAVIALLFWSRLYSPQFSLWWLPFATLLPLGGRTFATLVAADVAIFLTISPLGFLVDSAPGDPMRDALVALLAPAVVIRQVGLIRAFRDIDRPAPA